MGNPDTNSQCRQLSKLDWLKIILTTIIFSQSNLFKFPLKNGTLNKSTG